MTVTDAVGITVLAYRQVCGSKPSRVLWAATPDQCATFGGTTGFIPCVSEQASPGLPAGASFHAAKLSVGQSVAASWA